MLKGEGTDDIHLPLKVYVESTFTKAAAERSHNIKKKLKHLFPASLLVRRDLRASLSYE